MMFRRLLRKPIQEEVVMMEIGGVGELRYEDNGQAAILELEGDPDDPVFLRIQSWIDNGEPASHVAVNRLAGKWLRVRIDIGEV